MDLVRIALLKVINGRSYKLQALLTRGLGMKLHIGGSGIRAMGEVVMNLVWKHSLRGPTAGNMHCTSTTIISTMPVRMAFSCCRKLPAILTPWRMATSFAVQQRPLC